MAYSRAALFIGFFALTAAWPLGARQGGLPGIELKATADRTITVRINAPQAKDVRVLVDTMKADTTMPLVRDASGVWSATLGPFAPDIYLTSSIIDGVAAPLGYAHVTGPVPVHWPSWHTSI